ncbi:hypothetical protein NMY22_g1447 [Coprinellus aureogranulatus]|nr:hypothetical protein NMY22_g1447 [Coprinellus aureogranulatus]
MHQCLGVQEILSGIVKNLERNDALQLALSSKNFLGPSMDHLWRDISSFEPLIACLPSDIWEGKIVSLEGNADSFTVILHPRYSIKSEHLHRYVKLYAPRIRSFSLDIFEEMKIPSIEALQALELATARQQGALSPLLTKFTWYDAKAAAGILGADFSANLAPRMHLFLGQHIEVLKASDLNANDPLLHKASMDLAFNCFANTLKHMTLGMYGVRVNEIVKSFSWNRLESACLFFPSLATVLSLASLPCLEVLVILGFSVENDFNGPSKSPPPTPYQALRYLACHSDSFHDIRPFLDRFPTRNALQTLTLGEYRHSSSLTEVQNLIGAIGHLCDPSSFTSLNVWCRTHCDPVTEPLEISFPDHIDLAPLYKFRNMKTLYLSLAHSVTLTPDIITQIPVVWPQLETLALCEQFPDHPATHRLHWNTSCNWRLASPPLGS